MTPQPVCLLCEASVALVTVCIWIGALALAVGVAGAVAQWVKGKVA